MKPKVGRELALISLPLLIIGGAAWLLAGSGRALLPARFDNGPARFGFSEIESIEVAPVDVYRGYDWAGRTRLWERGKFDIPAGWTQLSAGTALTENYRLVYRQGKTWKKVAENSREIIDLSVDVSANVKTFSVNLEAVPANADEVHLRGEFHWVEMYSGTVPPGWKAPANFARYGLRNVFTLPVQHFDVAVVAPGQSRPRPVVAHETGIEVVKATYGVYNDIGIKMQLRHKPGYGKSWGGSLRLLSLKFVDAQGHKLDICDAKDQHREPPGLSWLNSDFPDHPATDIVLGAAQGDYRSAQPCGGWAKYRGPFMLEAVVSDEDRWPIRVKVPMPASVSK